MNEEELKAVKETEEKISTIQEGLDKGYYYGERYNYKQEILREQTLLNIIEKQQEQIEKQQEEIGKLETYYDMTMNTLHTFTRLQDIIPKQVIREKIKELEEQTEEFIEKEMFGSFMKANDKLEALKELLEE